MRVNKSQFVTNSGSSDTKEKVNKYYVLQGIEDFLDDYGYPRSNDYSDNVCAKAVADKPTKHFGDTRGKDYRYYIRMDADQELFNPVQILSSVKDKKSNHFINSVCKSTDSFKEVSPSIFNSYIEYLKSKDIRWLKDAQRELI